MLRKRILAILVSCMMVISMFPLIASASDTGEFTTSIHEFLQDLEHTGYGEYQRYSVTLYKENVYHIHDAVKARPANSSTNSKDNPDTYSPNPASMYMILGPTTAIFVDGGNGGVGNFQERTFDYRPYRKWLRDIANAVKDIGGVERKLVILLTHGHPDHTGAFNNQTGYPRVFDEDVPFFYPQRDYPNPDREPLTNFTDIIPYDFGQTNIKIGDYAFDCIGFGTHTPGSNALICQKLGIVVSSDTIGSAYQGIGGGVPGMVAFETSEKQVHDAMLIMDNPIILNGHAWQQVRGYPYDPGPGVCGIKYVEDQLQAFEAIRTGTQLTMGTDRWAPGHRAAISVSQGNMNTFAATYRSSKVGVYIATEKVNTDTGPLSDGLTYVSGDNIVMTRDYSKYFIAVGNADKLKAVTVEIEVNGKYFDVENALIAGLNDFTIGSVAWTKQHGTTWTLSVTVTADAAAGYTSFIATRILSLMLPVNNVIGTSEVKLTKVELSSEEDNGYSMISDTVSTYIEQ